MGRREESHTEVDRPWTTLRISAGTCKGRHGRGDPASWTARSDERVIPTPQRGPADRVRRRLSACPLVACYETDPTGCDTCRLRIIPQKITEENGTFHRTTSSSSPSGSGTPRPGLWTRPTGCARTSAGRSSNGMAELLGLQSRARRTIDAPSTGFSRLNRRLPPMTWSGRRDSNPRPPPWQGGSLPLSHVRVDLRV